MVQAEWPADSESTIDKHDMHSREAERWSAQVVCFQELFHLPYSCQVQDTKLNKYPETLPGPVIERFQSLAEEL